MGTDERRDRAAALQSAAATARQRFGELQDAFNAMESAHKRGDYSPSPDLQRRVEEFRRAASKVHRLASEFRAASETLRDHTD